MLDDHLPRYDVHEVHSTTVDAEPETVIEAARQVIAREVPLLVALMVLGAGPRAGRLSIREPVLEQFQRAGFVLLRAAPDQLVYGGVGRFRRA